MWSSISIKLKINIIMLNAIPVDIPVGECEPSQAHKEATRNESLPAPSWEPQTSSHEPPSHTTSTGPRSECQVPFSL